MMNVLKNPSFFRPASRPSSPAPASQPPSRPNSGLGFEPAGARTHKLSLSNFRRPSPSRHPGSSLPPTPAPLVQDGSYLEVLNLKLSEAVSKVLVQPTAAGVPAEQVGNRKPAQGRGHTLSALITSELQATRDNPHLQRAILRLLHRPLSVLLNNLSSQLLLIITSPAFVTAPAPSLQSPNPNTAQTHALAIASFAGDLLQTFDELGLGLDGDARGDGLKDIREGLVSIVNRVIQPMLTNIKNELLPLLDALETPRSTKILGSKGFVHQSIATLQVHMPIYAKTLSRYMTSTACDTMLATFIISLIWRGVVALAHRPLSNVSIPSPALLPVGSSRKYKGSPTMTPPLTPPPGRFMKLPPSRPPSPVPETNIDPTAADARALYELFLTLPRPSGNKERAKLAKEAVDDALEPLKALTLFLEHVNNSRSGVFHGDNALAVLDNLTAEIPLLISLPVLLRALDQPTSVPCLLGVVDEEYRRACLSGFGRAEECALAVAERIDHALCLDANIPPVMLQWLELEIAETAQN